MSQFLMFYFTSSVLNMFRTLIHPSSGVCDFSIVSPHWSVFLFRCVLEFRCGWGGMISVWQASTISYVLFHFFCAQHVSDINTSIIRSLRLFQCITTLVCVLVSICVGVSVWLVGVVSVQQASACYTQAEACYTDTTPTSHTETPTHIETRTQTNVVIQQKSRRLLMMDVLMSETC